MKAHREESNPSHALTSTNVVNILKENPQIHMINYRPVSAVNKKSEFKSRTKLQSSKSR